MKHIPKYAGGGGIGKILSQIIGGGFGGDNEDEGSIDNGEKMGDMLNTGVGVATDIIGAATAKGKYTHGAKAKAIGSGIGAAAGLAFGVPGVGSAVGGLIGGLIGGNKDRNEMADDQSNLLRKAYNQNVLQPNMGKFGDSYGDGGMTGDEAPEAAAPVAQAPKMKQINVERGELMIDPATGDIVRKFTNPSRYSSHQKKQLMEPIGNFVEVPDNMVIIPKKKAARYENGDTLTRKSIMLQLLSDQATDPLHNAPEEVKEQEGIAENPEEQQYAAGGSTGPGPKAFSFLKNILSGIDNIPNVANITKNVNDAPDYQTTPSVGNKSTPENTNDWEGDNEIPIVDLNLKGHEDKLPATAATGKTNPAGKKDWNMIARKAVQNLPVFAQMANAMHGDPFLGYNPNTEYNNAMGLAGELPEDISIAGTLANNNNSYAGAVQAINNNDTPTTRAEAAEIYSRKLQADNNAYQGKEQVSAGLKSNKLQQLMGLTTASGADAKESRGTLMNEQRMDKAARENIMFAGASNLTKNNLQAQNDTEKIKALNEMTHFFNVDPYMKKKLADDPGMKEYVINYVLGGGTDIKAAIAARDAEYKKVQEKTTTKSKQGNTTKTVTSNPG